MKLSLAMSALLCVLGVAVIAIPNTPGIYEEAIINTHSTSEEPRNVVPVRYVYIQFPGEDSKMIQLRNVSGVLSERLSEYSDIE